jgi:hypothetical protein
MPFADVTASGFGKHIFSPSQRWPHQHVPSALMMQVPVPQHLGSSLIQVLHGSTVGSAVVGNGVVIKLHVRASQRTVFGGATFHARAPQTKRAGVELCTHEANDLGLAQSHALKNGLKRGAVFPGHLNHGRHIARAQVGKTLASAELHQAIIMES